MSTTPWGTMNDWMRLEVEERTTMIERRIAADTARATRRTQAPPVVRPARTRTVAPIAVAAVIQPAVSQPAVSRAACAEAA